MANLNPRPIILSIAPDCTIHTHLFQGADVADLEICFYELSETTIASVLFYPQGGCLVSGTGRLISLLSRVREELFV